MPDLTGQIINNRYRVDAFIARGGMAEVYRVTDLHMGATLAMKVLRANLAGNRDYVESFQEEAKNLAALEHPNIVRFYRLEKVGQMVFMLLEYIDGTTLQKSLATRDYSSALADTLKILGDVCKALQYAHREGRVHCDVKPSNIMLDQQGKAYLTDFGIMRRSGSVTTMAGAGTPGYMAPEVIRCEQPTPATDLYALGIVLYEMLTGGRRPFDGDRAAVSGTTADKVRWEQQHLEPLLPSRYNQRISREMDALVLTCLAKHPAARYQSANEFMAALRQALGTMKGSAGQVKKPSGTTARPKPEEKPIPKWVWGVSGLLLLFAAIAWMTGEGGPFDGPVVLPALPSFLSATPTRSPVNVTTPVVVKGLFIVNRNTTINLRNKFELTICNWDRQDRSAIVTLIRPDGTQQDVIDVSRSFALRDCGTSVLLPSWTMNVTPDPGAGELPGMWTFIVEGSSTGRKAQISFEVRP